MTCHRSGCNNGLPCNVDELIARLLFLGIDLTSTGVYNQFGSAALGSAEVPPSLRCTDSEDDDDLANAVSRWEIMDNEAALAAPVGPASGPAAGAAPTLIPGGMTAPAIGAATAPPAGIAPSIPAGTAPGIPIGPAPAPAPVTGGNNAPTGQGAAAFPPDDDGADNYCPHCPHCVPHSGFLAPPVVLAPPPEAWYTVTVGRRVGIFNDWSLTQPLVSGVPHACYRRYSSEAAARTAFAEALTAGTVVVVGLPGGNNIPISGANLDLVNNY